MQLLLNVLSGRKRTCPLCNTYLGTFCVFFTMNTTYGGTSTGFFFEEKEYKLLSKENDNFIFSIQMKFVKSAHPICNEVIFLKQCV